MRELWQHQKECVASALKQRDFALFLQMGTGKTGTMVTILRYKFGEVGHIRRTLILSPLITLQNWKKEFAEFSRIPQSEIVVLKGTGRQKNAQFIRETSHPKTGTLVQNKIIIANYEVVQNEELFANLMHWNPEILVLDEAHRVRNHQGKRAKAVCKLADKAQHRYIMTGTPILNDSRDVFFPYRIMNGGKSFGDNFYAFQGRYFKDANAKWAGKQGYFPDYQERQELYDEIHQKMYFYGKERIADRKLAKDCIDLPPLVNMKIEVEMGSEQRKCYEEMKREFLTYVERLKDEGTPIAVVANLAITKALRLQQIASGFVKAEDGKEYEIKDNTRLTALKDFLEDAAGSKGAKVIVWACFKNNYSDIARLCGSLSLPYRMLTGEQTIAEKEQAMTDFKTDPSVKVMIANQASGGIGVNLIGALIAVFYSRNFSL